MSSLTRVLFALVLSLVTHASASATTWWVSPCGSDAWSGLNPACAAPHGPKRTIQAAIAVAADGDTINVMAGVYPGGLDTVGKAVHVIGVSGKDFTFVDGGAVQRCLTCDTLEGPDTIFEGISFIDGFSVTHGGGVWIDFASPTFIECAFTGCWSGDMGGAVAIEVASPTFDDCDFDDNIAVQGGGGVYLGVNGYPTFSYCGFDNNTCTNGDGGAFINVDAHPTFESCNFAYNTAENGGAIDCNFGSLAVIGCNFDDDTANSTGGSIHAFAAEVTINVGSIEDSSGWAGGGGIELHNCESTVTAMVIQENWSNDWGGGLHVHGGTAVIDQCAFSQNRGWNGGAIALRDCDATVTNVTCSANEAEFGGAGVLCVNATVTMDEVNFWTGVCFRAGGMWCNTTDLTMSNCEFLDNLTTDDGAAMFIIESTLDVTNTSFENNSTQAYGGAIYLWDVTTTPIFEACTFTSNFGRAGGGAVFTDASRASFTGCMFDDNASHIGGAFRCSNAILGSLIELRGCTLQQNEAQNWSGGAMYLAPGYTVHATDCNFWGNDAVTDGGAILANAAALRMSNCDLSGNTAINGGAICAEDFSYVELVNVKLTQNDASTGGALFIDDGVSMNMTNCTSTLNSATIGGRSLTLASNASAEITNSILYGDTGDSIASSGDLTCRYSIVPAAFAGPGCMSIDPMFVDVVSGDFSLDAASPGIDAGLTWALPDDVADADDDGNTAETIEIDRLGNPRVMDAGGCGAGGVDIGAFEFAGAIVTPIDGDIDGDGVVGTSDMLLLIAEWGASGCPMADLDGDGVVGLGDLLILLGEWS